MLSPAYSQDVKIKFELRPNHTAFSARKSTLPALSAGKSGSCLERGVFSPPPLNRKKLRASNSNCKKLRASNSNCKKLRASNSNCKKLRASNSNCKKLRASNYQQTGTKTLQPAVRQATVTSDAPCDNTTARGGDAPGCLSSLEIDQVLKNTIFPADTFWRLKNGSLDIEHIRSRLRPGITVFHTHHHWLLLHFVDDTLHVYDSAQSVPVYHAVRTLASRLHLGKPVIHHCPQQIRGSNECGLFTIVHGLMITANLPVPRTRKAFSLAHLRAAFPCADSMLKLAQDTFRAATADTTRTPPPPPRSTRWRHSPYGAGPTHIEDSSERGSEDEAAPVARFTHNPFLAPNGGASPVEVEDTNTRDDALSELTIAEERYANALRVAAHNDGLQGSDLDHLIAIAKAEGTNDVSVISVVGRRPVHLTRNYLKPIHVGASNSGHYFLLYVDRRGVTYVFNSLPSFRPHESLEAIRAVTGSDPNQIIDIGPQGTEECGFCVVNAAREILGVTFMLRAPPGHLRARYAPDLVQARLAELEAARAAVALLASPGHYSSGRSPDAVAPTELTAATFEPILRALRVGDRISCCFSERPNADGTLFTPVTWHGVVQRPFDAQLHHVQVRWDRDCPGIRPPYTAPLPAYELPNRDWVYLNVTVVGHAFVQKTTPPASPAPAHKAAKLTTTPKPQGAHASVSSAPANLSTKPTTVSHGAVRVAIRNMLPGTLIQMAYAQGDNFVEAVARIRSRQSNCATVDLVASRCPYCDSWEDDEQEDIQLTIPQADCLYTSFKAVNSIPETICLCEHVESAELPLDANSEFLEDRQTIGSPLAEVSDNTLKGTVGRRWFIHRHRPPHVHAIVWRQVAASTRSQHIRWLEALRSFPDDIARLPLASAIVEYVQRLAQQREWAYSTVASALSAFASALSALPIYTNAPSSINIRDDPVFAAASKRAQHLARITVKHGPKDLLTPSEVDRLLKTLPTPSSRLLLRLGWLFAARVGDVRQVTSSDVVIPRHAKGPATATITFRFGKGAAFWGPYSIHAVIDETTSKALAALRAERPYGPLFDLRDQAQLSKQICELGHTLRAIRRGALTHLAQSGVSDHHLQLLSGHKRHDTLMRYLGWGAQSADSAAAAQLRHRVAPAEPLIHGAGHPDEPPVMTAWSGYNGNRGRRIQKPPSLFVRSTPSHADLGIEPPCDDIDSWPLHIKDVGLVDWNAIHKLAVDTPWEESAKQAQAYCEDATIYPQRVYRQDEIPYSRISQQRKQELLAAGKIAPFSGAIRGYAKGFLLPQSKKRRLRPIFEPSSNSFFIGSKLLKQRYPSRLQRRARARGRRFAHEIDFSAYFDQFGLSVEVQAHYVIKIRGPQGPELFCLTRLPMGATFAPGVAQTVTWIVVAPLLRCTHVSVDTMIDNIRVCADSLEDLRSALKTLQCRSALANITVNDDFGAVDLNKFTPSSDYTFLGERYTISNGEQVVGNTPANLEKLRAALDALHHRIPSLRQLASLLGLAFWMAHTINVDITEFSALLRGYSGIASQQAGNWDDPLPFLAPTLRNAVEDLCNIILRDPAFPLPILRQPSYAEREYDLVVFTDASASGWGALVLETATGTVTSLQQRWHGALQHSAHAEPQAVCRALDYIAEHSLTPKRIALITDHIALATGQRRWFSNHGGVSVAHQLNCAFKRMHSHSIECDTFYLAGDQNPADALSRDSASPLSVRALRCAVRLPALARAWHPFACDDRPIHCV